MQIEFKTDEQKRIADLLWNCQSQKEVNIVIRAFGIQAQIVKEMILAATYDQIQETDLAERVLVDIMYK